MPQFSLELKPSETVVLQMSGSTSKNYLSLFLSTAWIKPHATFSDYFSFSWNWLGNKQQRTIKPKRHLWRVVTPKLCPKARRQKLLSTFVLRKKTQTASLWRHQAPSMDLMSREGANACCHPRSGILWAPLQSKQIQNTALESKELIISQVAPQTYTNNVFTWLYTLLVKITMVKRTGEGAKYDNIQK